MLLLPRAHPHIYNITLCGVGSGTEIDYVQAHYGKDDGIELFGGTVNLKHILSTQNNDDGLLYAGRVGVVDEPDQPAASWGTLTYAEVAERLGMPLGSIGPTRARCLERLRGLLEGTALTHDGLSAEGDRP